MTAPRVTHTRIVVTTAAYEQVLSRFRDVLGMPTEIEYTQPGGDVVAILDGGRASVEIGTPEHALAIDAVEGSSVAAPQFRLAVESADTAATHAALLAAGAVELAPPIRTPWGSLNSRVELAAGIQATVFEQTVPGPETGPA